MTATLTASGNRRFRHCEDGPRGVKPAGDFSQAENLVGLTAERSCVRAISDPSARIDTDLSDGAATAIPGTTKEPDMMTSRRFYLNTAAAVSLVALATAPFSAIAQNAVTLDNDDIGGVVNGPGGPEAGVWVIAETTDLPVRFIRIVVTDDQGRYVIPDLPKANYDVWVRGYGLVDSPKVKSEPGKQLNLTAVPAPNAAEAAKYYPAIYWYAMMKIPEAEVFGG